MKILLTGGTGMVGRNFLQYSHGSTHQVLSPTSSELNLLDYESTLMYLEKQNPEIIVHAAGLVGGIQANIKQPSQFLVKNYEMGKNIILAAQQAKITRIINLGSSCMYPRNIDNPLREEYVLKGELEPTNEGYALAKIAVARLCQYIMSENSELQYKTFIPCNLFGKWDKFDEERSHLLPAIIHKLHSAKKNGLQQVEIWGDGLARREFMYAEDLVDFLYFAIDNFERVPALINVGPGTDYTINEYYETSAQVIGYNGVYKHNLDKPVGMKRKLVDISLLNQLGWSSKTSLIEGLEKSYEYYLNLGE